MVTTIQNKYDDVCNSVDQLATAVAVACHPFLADDETVTIRSYDEEYYLSAAKRDGVVIISAAYRNEAPGKWYEIKPALKLKLCPLLVQLHGEVECTHSAKKELSDDGQSDVTDGYLAEQLQAIHAKLDTLLEGTK